MIFILYVIVVWRGFTAIFKSEAEGSYEYTYVSKVEITRLKSSSSYGYIINNSALVKKTVKQVAYTTSK